MLKFLLKEQTNSSEFEKNFKCRIIWKQNEKCQYRDKWKRSHFFQLLSFQDFSIIIVSFLYLTLINRKDRYGLTKIVRTFPMNLMTIYRLKTMNWKVLTLQAIGPYRKMKKNLQEKTILLKDVVKNFFHIILTEENDWK